MESPPNELTVEPSRRRRPRTVIAGLVLVGVFGLIVFLLLRRPQKQAGLIEQIKAVGGFVSHDPPASLQERISAYRQGVEWEQGYTSVRLYTSDVTGDWLHEHDDLSTLNITDLTLAETALTDADLAQLIAAHPLQVVEMRDEDIGEQTVDALAGSGKLFMLTVRESPLDDGQFARLPLEQLEELRIDDTSVTSAGLQELRRAGKLAMLTLDGRQLDDGVTQVLSRLPALRALELVGNAITDDHLARLHGFTALAAIRLRSTAATPEGVKSLEEALPNCAISRR
jgi:hypothetical protein